MNIKGKIQTEIRASFQIRTSSTRDFIPNDVHAPTIPRGLSALNLRPTPIGFTKRNKLLGIKNGVSALFLARRDVGIWAQIRVRKQAKVSHVRRNRLWISRSYYIMLHGSEVGKDKIYATFARVLWALIWYENLHLILISINIYIITQVILAFWLVLAYDLSEDRCSINVIVAKFFPLCFKMTEGFENLHNILHDWVKDKYKKALSRHWTGTRSKVWQEKER